MSDRLDAILAEAVPGVCPAAVALIAVDGAVVAASAAGELVRYRDAAFTLAEYRPPASREAVFDLASISKLFTTAAVLSLAEEGVLGLDEPVAAWLPGRDPRITLRRLLTHTAGFQPTRRIDLELPDASPAARMAAMVSTPVTSPVGGPYLYSDVGLVMAGRVAELASGFPLDQLVRARVTGPLNLTATGYRPVSSPPTQPTTDSGPPYEIGSPTPPAPTGGLSQGVADLSRVAATEWKPERPGPGCVRGEVHDETAYALGGVAGHAGVFGTADDVLALGEALRLGGGAALRPDTVAEMLRDQGVTGAPFRHGLGVRIGDPGIVGPLDDAFGHSGFTGTSLIVSPSRRLTAVLLTNAVHPLRGRPGVRDLRTAIATEALRLSS
ncbi:serine hydrolase domain-containing protein [Nonomuraea ferruginea]|uniref:Serine hydrolase n=1 Tax=Nonomuraea ferruginea TaxID=46174 RepID=A0ABT4SWW0_9ACTN|nr:serine hydrolase domain-containing protein [Nonomuraea ferruginea]MDA0641692.1 serine hydrolase [Nonomuraea ferruginea]